MHKDSALLMEDLALIEKRAQETRAVQSTILPTWEFADWPLTAMDTDRAAYDVQKGLADDADSDASGARGSRNGELDTLHEWTKGVVAGGKDHFHGDPGNAARFANLTAGSDTIGGRLKEAEKAITAWENSDAAWKPSDAITLTAFKAKYDLCKLLDKSADKAGSDASAAHKVKNVLANGLWVHCVAWYNLATSLYGPTTEVGALVRAQITVSSDGAPAPVVTPPAPDPPA